MAKGKATGSKQRRQRLADTECLPKECEECEERKGEENACCGLSPLRLKSYSTNRITRRGERCDQSEPC
jgi:hypothetical protein